MSDIASMTNHAFFSELLYRAHMADAITDAECREACMRLWIDYPPKTYTSNEPSMVVQIAD